MARSHHANRFSTTLSVQMSPTSLNASVVTTAGGPASPCYLVIDHDVPAKAEIVLFDGAFDGTTFRCTSLANRYLTGSAATSGITHEIGAKVISAPLGSSMEDIWDAIEGGGMTTDVQVFTANGTWTKPAGAVTVRVQVQGGGGAGGGAATTNSQQRSFGGGGQGGAYAESTIAAATLGDLVAVTVGAAGTGVNGGMGNNGTSSAFGGYVTAGGGGGADVVTADDAASVPGAQIGQTMTGMLQIPGGGGGSASRGGDPGGGQGGQGGNSFLGNGGRSVTPSLAGGPGGNYGGGGGGAANDVSQNTARPGGNGGAGVVIVTTTF